MKFENTDVWGFKHAIHGMRNPKNSWDKSDSYDCLGNCDNCKQWTVDKYINETVCRNRLPYEFIIGVNDMKLAQSLIKAGSEHRKFMRQIFVSVDITAPLYWWKEFDTYKVGTVANSTSTMHKIISNPITIDCFETGDYDKSLSMIDNSNIGIRAECFIDDLEQLRQQHISFMEASKNNIDFTQSEREEFAVLAKKYWKELIRFLPESWLQTRTVTMNYENLLAMCSKGQRRFHKLNEWSGQDNPDIPNFISWARTLPYAQELIFIDELAGKEV